jgi:predicted nucleic acid-binding protein
MTLIDTSAWIEFLRRNGDSVVKGQVASYLEAGEAAVCAPIEFELLSGARPAEISDIHAAVSFCRMLEFSQACWRRAADVERELRAIGVTVPRDDIFVATAALEYDLPIYCSDAHFELMRSKGGQNLELMS